MGIPGDEFETTEHIHYCQLQERAERHVHNATCFANQIRRCHCEGVPFGTFLVGGVLNPTLNHNSWKKNPYLYVSLLWWNNEHGYTLSDDIPFRIGMELLLYTCVKKVMQDKHLLQKVC